MPYRLIPVAEGADIPLDKPIVLVGRHPECDVQIPSRKVSRKHCIIAQVSDYLVVRDLFSTNGVQINGVRVEEGSLKLGDELAIGSFRYHVSIGTSEENVRARDKMPEVEQEMVEQSDLLDQPVALDAHDERAESPTQALPPPLNDEDDITLRPFQ